MNTDWHHYSYWADHCSSHGVPVQIPVSQKDNIRVEDYEIGLGSLEEDLGEVSWKLSLQASEKEELMLQYRIKYPKFMRIVLD